MSDEINAKGSDSTFKPHEPGQFPAICADVVDLGERVETFAGQPAKLTHKCALVFITRSESGESGEVSREFTVSMGEKANLRKFLEQWRGRKYDADQVEQGVPLHKLEGQVALLTISHNTSGQGKTYANITACVGIPRQMKDSAPAINGYKRSEFWADRKKRYADEARKFRVEEAPDQEYSDDSSLPDDDDLPF